MGRINGQNGVFRRHVSSSLFQETKVKKKKRDRDNVKDSNEHLSREENNEERSRRRGKE